MTSLAPSLSHSLPFLKPPILPIPGKDVNLAPGPSPNPALDVIVPARKPKLQPKVKAKVKGNVMKPDFKPSFVRAREGLDIHNTGKEQDGDEDEGSGSSTQAWLGVRVTSRSRERSRSSCPFRPSSSPPRFPSHSRPHRRTHPPSRSPSPSPTPSATSLISSTSSYFNDDNEIDIEDIALTLEEEVQELEVDRVLGEEGLGRFGRGRRRVESEGVGGGGKGKEVDRVREGDEGGETYKVYVGGKERTAIGRPARSQLKPYARPTDFTSTKRTPSTTTTSTSTRSPPTPLFTNLDPTKLINLYISTTTSIPNFTTSPPPIPLSVRASLKQHWPNHPTPSSILGPAPPNTPALGLGSEDYSYSPPQGGWGWRDAWVLLADVARYVGPEAGVVVVRDVVDARVGKMRRKLEEKVKGLSEEEGIAFEQARVKMENKLNSKHTAKHGSGRKSLREGYKSLPFLLRVDWEGIGKEIGRRGKREREREGQEGEGWRQTSLQKRRLVETLVNIEEGRSIFDEPSPSASHPNDNNPAATSPETSSSSLEPSSMADSPVAHQVAQRQDGAERNDAGLAMGKGKEKGKHTVYEYGLNTAASVPTENEKHDEDVNMDAAHPNNNSSNINNSNGLSEQEDDDIVFVSETGPAASTISAALPSAAPSAPSSEATVPDDRFGENGMVARRVEISGEEMRTNEDTGPAAGGSAASTGGSAGLPSGSSPAYLVAAKFSTWKAAYTHRVQPATTSTTTTSQTNNDAVTWGQAVRGLTAEERQASNGLQGQKRDADGDMIMEEREGPVRVINQSQAERPAGHTTLQAGPTPAAAVMALLAKQAATASSNNQRPAPPPGPARQTSFPTLTLRPSDQMKASSLQAPVPPNEVKKRSPVPGVVPVLPPEQVQRNLAASAARPQQAQGQTTVAAKKTSPVPAATPSTMFTPALSQAELELRAGERAGRNVQDVTLRWGRTAEGNVLPNDINPKVQNRQILADITDDLVILSKLVDRVQGEQIIRSHLHWKQKTLDPRARLEAGDIRMIRLFVQQRWGPSKEGQQQGVQGKQPGGALGHGNQQKVDHPTAAPVPAVQVPAPPKPVQQATPAVTKQPAQAVTSATAPAAAPTTSKRTAGSVTPKSAAPAPSSAPIAATQRQPPPAQTSNDTTSQQPAPAAQQPAPVPHQPASSSGPPARPAQAVQAVQQGNGQQTAQGQSAPPPATSTSTTTANTFISVLQPPPALARNPDDDQPKFRVPPPPKDPNFGTRTRRILGSVPGQLGSMEQDMTVMEVEVPMLSEEGGNRVCLRCVEAVDLPGDGSDLDNPTVWPMEIFQVTCRLNDSPWFYMASPNWLDSRSHAIDLTEGLMSGAHNSLSFLFRHDCRNMRIVLEYWEMGSTPTN